MKKIIIFTALTLTCTACDQLPCANVDVAFSIYVANSAGEDLLSPTNPNAYSEEGIRIFYQRKTGEWDLYYHPQSDNPNGVTISPKSYYNSDSLACIGMAPRNFSDGNPSYSGILIKWNNQDADTIRCESVSDECLTVCTKLWLNGTLVWDRDATPLSHRAVTIIR